MRRRRLDRLRHGATGRLFEGVRAPSALGTFLRAFTRGHNRRLHTVHRDFLARLAAATPLLPGVDRVAVVDVDPTHRRVHGRAKQGAEVGRFKDVRTLDPILAALSTTLARPVIAAVRPRRGKAADAHGASGRCIGTGFRGTFGPSVRGGAAHDTPAATTSEWRHGCLLVGSAHES